MSASRVLVVDDEPLLLRAMERILRTEHEVVTAGSAPDALAILADDRAFDVILCDVNLPELTGIDLYDALRRRWPGLEERMVFLTGDGYGGETGRFLDAVENPVLRKPFEAPLLRNTVREVIESS